MSFIKAFCVAFAIYSKIPMPNFEWEDEELRLHLIFFPFVGAVIGALTGLWYLFAARVGVNQLAYVCICAAIPLIVTGGFHVDGYMDTMDALKSYKSREDKLQILKDPHIGAFSVIMLGVAGLLYLAGISGINGKDIVLLGLGFVLSRILSAIAVIAFPKAKREGMLSAFSSSCGGKSKTMVMVILFAELLACIAFACIYGKIVGIIVIGTALLIFGWYYYKTKKEFGGITGDTAGCFVTICEIAIALVLSLYTNVAQIFVL